MNPMRLSAAHCIFIVNVDGNSDCVRRMHSSERRAAERPSDSFGANATNDIRTTQPLDVELGLL